jgi:hypothetical protein
MMRSPVSPRPPQLAAWLAAARLRGDEREFQLGDLEEEFAIAPRAMAWRRRGVGTGAMRFATCSQEGDGGALREQPPSPIPSPGDLMRSIRQDFSFAFRLMRRAPVATLAAIVTFALALAPTSRSSASPGRCCSQPLPFADEARLTVVQLIFTRGGRSFPNNGLAGRLLRHAQGHVVRKAWRATTSSSRR